MLNSFSEPIYCQNPTCPEPRNTFGRQHCAACETELVYRYLWAVGPKAEEVPRDKVIADRYFVIAPQIWLESRPDLPPNVPEQLPDAIVPYLHLYSQRLHVPEVYGFCQWEEAGETMEVLLLENAPIDSYGSLYPAILEAWSQTSAVRQIYWLWQMLQLWTPLSEQGMASSLLVPENLRVDGPRVRMLQLHRGNYQPALRDLGDVWSGLVETAQPQVQSRLREICQFMRRSSMNFEAIALELNELLLEQAAQLPLSLSVVGMTDTGPQRSHNEDSCYPTAADFYSNKNDAGEKLIPYLTIVCDGVGGHDGGEVASQLAVQSLKALIQNLLAETVQQEELLPPAMVMKQLEEIVRVVNNVISAQNNAQGKELRQRMGTTLVMALQLPQKMKISEEVRSDNCHELYLVNVGDSRAYWISSESCVRLTVDDDVASREVALGHNLYWEAQKRSDAGALTQALGTRDADFLHPTIQRFVIEDEGLLLLCSDGLSDNDWVENYWKNFGPAVLKGDMSLEDAAIYLVRLANEKNGYDNTSVVMTHCRMSPEKVTLFQTKSASPSLSLPMSGSMSGQVAVPVSNPISVSVSTPMSGIAAESKLSESSKQLLYAENAPSQAPQKPSPFKFLVPLLGLLALMLGGLGLGLWVRNRPNPEPAIEEIPADSPEATPTPSSEESPTPSSEESPTPSSEESPTPSSEESPTPSSEENPSAEPDSQQLPELPPPPESPSP
ncbi:MAG: protein phosphatase 2C domain-containing protein [Oscillatoriaceae cyanobacterium Prado104]|jgi:protein phosphatase|nr:protein phosphatase 2C domain-containing protein [Oscillatoriaceae cyanobacterium Prado104]